MQRLVTQVRNRWAAPGTRGAELWRDNMIIYYLVGDAEQHIQDVGQVLRHTRAEDKMRFIARNAVDPYLFIRSAYLEHRRFLIYDGSPPLSDYEVLDIDE